MDGPTLDVMDGPYEEEEGEDEVDFCSPPWGRLFPLNKCFAAQDLVMEEYSFGRGDECDHCFETQNGTTKNEHFLALSKTHFRIYREKVKSKDTEYTAFIQDKSSNGTFINGEKIGKNKRRVLNSDDEIALSYKNNKAFIFNNCEAPANSKGLPEDFKAKYTLSKFLGRGACGEVKLAFEKDTCKKVAVKIVSKKVFSVGPVLGRAAQEEVNILKSIQHPCIIHIEDVFDGSNALYIVLELIEGGELFDRVVAAGKFSENTSKLFFYQMLMAIKYLHDRGITHRDIKPENILLASDDEETLIKITDFGLSKFVGENSLMKTLCGTPSYLAPEILESAGTCGYSKAVDLWSMGVILYIMLAGYPPFSDDIKEYTLNDQILNARYSFQEKYWKGVSDQARDMIRRLLTLDPKSRITIPEAMDHPWLQDEEVVGRAKALIEQAQATPITPPTSSQDRKRPAPPNNTRGPQHHPGPPAKRPNIQKPSTEHLSKTPSTEHLSKTPSPDLDQSARNDKTSISTNTSLSSED